MSAGQSNDAQSFPVGEERPDDVLSRLLVAVDAFVAAQDEVQRHFNAGHLQIARARHSLTRIGMTTDLRDELIATSWLVPSATVPLLRQFAEEDAAIKAAEEAVDAAGPVVELIDEVEEPEENSTLKQRKKPTSTKKETPVAAIVSDSEEEGDALSAQAALNRSRLLRTDDTTRLKRTADAASGSLSEFTWMRTHVKLAPIAADVAVVSDDDEEADLEDKFSDIVEPTACLCQPVHSLSVVGTSSETDSSTATGGASPLQANPTKGDCLACRDSDPACLALFCGLPPPAFRRAQSHFRSLLPSVLAAAIAKQRLEVAISAWEKCMST